MRETNEDVCFCGCMYGSNRFGKSHKPCNERSFKMESSLIGSPVPGIVKRTTYSAYAVGHSGNVQVLQFCLWVHSTRYITSGALRRVRILMSNIRAGQVQSD